MSEITNGNLRAAAAAAAAAKPHNIALHDQSDDIQHITVYDEHRSFERRVTGLGLLIGVFMQLTTLGVNSVVLNIMVSDEQEAVYKPSGLFGLPIMYSFITSCMAFAFLLLLRSLLAMAFHLGHPQRQQLNDNSTNAPVEFQEVLHRMDTRFIVGALIGVCASWAITHALIGQSAISPPVALFFIMLYIFCCCCWGRRHAVEKQLPRNDNRSQESASQNDFTAV